MAQNIQFKRGTKAKNDNFIGPDGSISVDKESKTLRIHDGTTAGGAFTILDQKGVQCRSKNSVRVATADVLGGVNYATTQTITARTTLAATGTTTSGSTSISAVSNAIYYVKVGATISGDGIPAGATVTAVASSTITISAAATATKTSVALTITNPLSALVVDGVTLAVGDRVLVKNEYLSRNGIYTLTTLGTASVPWVLTRTTDTNTWDDLPGATVYVEGGSVNAETSWKFTVKKGGTLGSTSITVVDESTVKTKTIGDNSQYIANTEYVSNYIGSWRIINTPDAGGDLVVSLTMAAASALSISGNPSNDVNLIFDDSIPSSINYRSRIIFNNTNKKLVVKNLTGPTVTIAKNARVTVYSNGSGFFRAEEDNELIYGNQSIGYVVLGNLEFSGTGIGRQSVRQWVSAISDAGYKTINFPVGCIPHSITGVTTGPENATAYSLKITYAKDGYFQYSFRVAVVNSSNAYVSGIPFNISVEGSM